MNAHIGALFQIQNMSPKPCSVTEFSYLLQLYLHVPHTETRVTRWTCAYTLKLCYTQLSQAILFIPFRLLT